MQPLRIFIQWAFLFFMIYMGVAFYRFVAYFRSHGTTRFVPRPDSIEGFLPISALLSLRDWLQSSSISQVHPAGLVIFLTIITISLLLKRSFCSWICPVGTLSELFWKSGFNRLKRNFRPPLWLDIALRGIKYLGLAFFLYTIFLAMAPEEVALFVNSDYNKTADVRLLDFFIHISPFAMGVILSLTLLSFAWRNPFCRFLCPYGALLGLISSLSPVKVNRDSKTCVSCGVCTQVCPSYIPVMQKERIVSPECIGCWRCISHCRAEGALSMRLTGRRIVVPGIVFALLVIILFWGGTMVGKLTGHWHTGISLGEYARLLWR
jgi:polyferredoxin